MDILTDFFPIPYLFVRSETTKSYDELFKVIRNKCVDFLGWSLKVQFEVVLNSSLPRILSYFGSTRDSP
ncbi:hypothetical protein F441_13318 [Phytophthora nicotianae CJ01A1]|uniref:Uncharacterized protein n=1 Tax=Phytophthora nicotianae CJ01A1 TaxID=1317063 RepID=W2WLA2_PHYNI|nr:hypothetical protein F441_13318 [Phytophthora nicotianae CJ01A1]